MPRAGPPPRSSRKDLGRDGPTAEMEILRGEPRPPPLRTLPRPRRLPLRRQGRPYRTGRRRRDRHLRQRRHRALRSRHRRRGRRLLDPRTRLPGREPSPLDGPHHRLLHHPPHPGRRPPLALVHGPGRPQRLAPPRPARHHAGDAHAAAEARRRAGMERRPAEGAAAGALRRRGLGSPAHPRRNGRHRRFLLRCPAPGPHAALVQAAASC